MELGELGEPMYEQGLLVLFREERGLLSLCSALVKEGSGTWTGRSKFNSFRSLRLGKGIGARSWGVFVFRCTWNLECWGSRYKKRSCYFWKKEVCLVSETTEEEGSGSFGEDLWCLEKEGAS